jgi:hypothetical protein
MTPDEAAGKAKDLYDATGRGYRNRRRQDPRIAAQILVVA